MTKNILYCCYKLKKIKIAKNRYIGTHFGIKTRKHAPAEKSILVFLFLSSLLICPYFTKMFNLQIFKLVFVFQVCWYWYKEDTPPYTFLSNSDPLQKLSSQISSNKLSCRRSGYHILYSAKCTSYSELYGKQPNCLKQVKWLFQLLKLLMSMNTFIPGYFVIFNLSFI